MLITPETRVGALLDAHPEVEEALVAFAPAFGNLRNPVLRRTVAKVATLEQVSRVAGVPLAGLLAFLRERLGQEAPALGPEAPPSRAGSGLPPWFDLARVVLVVDAAPFLARGEHPLQGIRQALARAAPGEIVELRAPFEPAPLMDLLGAEGVATACTREGDVFRTFLRKPQPRPA